MATLLKHKIIQAMGPDPSTLLDRHGDYLFRYAMFRLRDPMAAERVVQETLLAAMKGFSYVTGASSEKTWLVAILRHKILDRFRELNRVPPSDQMEEAVGDLDFQENGHWRASSAPVTWQAEPYQLIEQEEFWNVLSQGLSSLPTRTAAAFILREIDRLGPDEICEALNVSRENLWVTLHRARISLRRFLQVNWFDAPAKPTQIPSTNPSQLNEHLPTPTFVSFASDRRPTV